MKVRRGVVLLLVQIFVAVAAFAVEGRQVALRGGTIASIPLDSVGVLDTTGTDAFVFRADGKEIRIPYPAITSVNYRSEVARHLGVLPAMAAGLVRKRERKHLVTVVFNDAEGHSQLVLLELSKQLPLEVMATLQARAPQACASPAACKVQAEH